MKTQRFSFLQAGFFIKEIFRWKLERAKELVDDKIERIKTMAEGIMEEYGKPIEELEQTILKEAERIKNETSFLINSSVKTVSLLGPFIICNFFTFKFSLFRERKSLLKFTRTTMVIVTWTFV